MKGHRPSGVIYIAGTPFHVEAPVVNFRDPPFWDATKEYCISTATESAPACRPGGVPYGNLDVAAYTKNPKRYASRPALRSYYSSGKNPPLDAVKAVIKQFVVHHDGCNTSDMCFNVLQNERGLSVHFMIDNDGIVYQTIDLAWMAYHAADWNISSIGVELCNRGDVKLDMHYYDSGKYGPKRNAKPVKINGHTILAWEYTQAQWDSFVKLARDLTRLLPNLPAEFPQSSPGQQSWDTMPRGASFAFSGYIGHYHLTEQKWDPGPFDFKEFCRQLRGESCFPIFAKGGPTPQNPRPVVPKQIDDLKEAAKQLYAANEARADGGYFPVGPWGESRLWHGGVHLVGQENDPVFSPFPGRLVAARMGKSTAVGSANFVLMRHDMTLGPSKVQFYALYMHLVDELKEAKPPDWMLKGGWKDKNPAAGEIALIDEPIEAGQILGHVGKAGPGDVAKAQIHVEIFSTAELFAGVAGSPWQVVDGTGGGRFCDSKLVNDVIDANHDGTLSKQELTSFYSGGGAGQMHYLVTLHVSEWTAEPSWGESLRVPKDFKKYKPADIDELVAQQITPGLWWDAKSASHCRLPIDGFVYHYHPVTFVTWFHEQLINTAASAPTQVINANDAKEATSMGLKDDLADRDGTSMRSAADTTEDPCNAKLTLEQLVQGFEAPECGP
jgi:hypothetical protein